MKKQQIQNIVVHTLTSAESHSIQDKVNEIYIEVIEHRLEQSDLTIQEKISVIDKIIENIKDK